MIKKGLLTLTVATGALMFASQANADFVNFYGSIASGKVQKIDAGSLLYGGITATTGDQSGTRPMTIANSGSEIGIGVCGSSDGGNLCNRSEGTYDYSGHWNGQGDELESMGDQEWVTLTQGANAFTGDFMVGSFDNTEAGYMEWYDGISTQHVTFQHGTGMIPTAITDFTTGMASDYSFTNDFGNVWLLSIAGFSTADGMVTFRAGCEANDTNCIRYANNDNDYLVAAAAVVPIPAALPLFLSALGGLGLIGWRRKSAQAA